MNRDDFLQMSGIQHFVFCDRQWGLIHIDGIWADNDLTASGNIVHRNVDKGHSESRKSLKTFRSVRVASYELRLSGICDLVEVFESDDGEPDIIPVEYKRGIPKENDCDRVQLCAQAMALEEMLDVSINHGYIFYHAIRRRERVFISTDLRNRTKEASMKMHELFSKGEIPSPVYGPHCLSCSLYERCLPMTISANRPIEAYFKTKRKLIK
jgi:CRISPR-associated exonuclease Cas4